MFEIEVKMKRSKGNHKVSNLVAFRHKIAQVSKPP